MNIIPIKNALLSLSDKAGIVDFANGLNKLGINIFSTGGTSAALTQAKVPHRQIEEITGLPEMLGGRVKTLHPKIHGGILGLRDQHQEEAQRFGIEWIDLVVVNFYPFDQITKKMQGEEVIEYIDIGGPTLVRAAAKNYAWVGVVVDTHDYSSLLAEIEQSQGLSLQTRKKLAAKAFSLTSYYDAKIHHYFSKQEKAHAAPERLHLILEKQATLRYGENPHQKAFAYQNIEGPASLFASTQHQGKPLSFNNILDAEAGLMCVHEFDEPTCVIIKHANPCGVASACDIEQAYTQALEVDPISAFGGIVALNRPCTLPLATAIAKVFTEVVIAPAYTPEALTLLSAKPNLRLLEIPLQDQDTWEMKWITGGLLRQEKDRQVISAAQLKVVTQVNPRAEDIEAMLFAWRVLKHVKSNGILIAKNKKALGIGAGQVSRIDAVDLAVRKAGNQIENSILASDAFFPFRDSIDRIAKTGIRAIIQPGGSVKDAEVIEACNQYGIAMVLTGMRCFKH